MRSAAPYKHGIDRGAWKASFGPISHCDGGPIRDMSAAMGGVGFALYRAPACGHLFRYIVDICCWYGQRAVGDYSHLCRTSLSADFDLVACNRTLMLRAGQCSGRNVSASGKPPPCCGFASTLVALPNLSLCAPYCQ